MRWHPVRITVRRLMASVGLLAFGLAAIRHAVTSWGAREVLVIAPTVLLATNVLAWFQRARWQVFWVGFGFSGWAYLTFSLTSPLAEHLPTARFLDELHVRLYANQTLSLYDADDRSMSAQISGDAFRRAGQSVFTLIFALLGGSLASVLFPPRAEVVVKDVPFPPDGSLLKTGWRDEVDGRL